MNINNESCLKTLSAYGRQYVIYLLNGIARDRCYQGVLQYLDAVESEIESKGTLTEEDVFKLRQIFFRTNNDTPPKKPEYHLFLSRKVDP